MDEYNMQNQPYELTKELKRIIKKKGYMVKEIATRWDITPRRMSQILKKPSYKEIDAIYGIPENIFKK